MILSILLYSCVLSSMIMYMTVTIRYWNIEFNYIRFPLYNQKNLIVNTYSSFGSIKQYYCIFMMAYGDSIWELFVEHHRPFYVPLAVCMAPGYFTGLIKTYYSSKQYGHLTYFILVFVSKLCDPPPPKVVYLR